MMNGENPADCKRCVIAENNQSTHSPKYWSNQRFIDDIDFLNVYETTDSNGFIDPDLFRMKRWDIRFSNTCNFGCRMCNQKHSTFIAAENKFYAQEPDNKQSTIDYYIDRFSKDANLS